MKAVLGALAVTAVAFVVIFGLDKVAEAWPKGLVAAWWLHMVEISGLG